MSQGHQTLGEYQSRAFIREVVVNKDIRSLIWIPVFRDDLTADKDLQALRKLQLFPHKEGLYRGEYLQCRGQNYLVGGHTAFQAALTDDLQTLGQDQCTHFDLCIHFIQQGNSLGGLDLQHGNIRNIQRLHAFRDHQLFNAAW